MSYFSTLKTKWKQISNLDHLHGSTVPFVAKYLMRVTVNRRIEAGPRLHAGSDEIVLSYKPGASKDLR